MAEIRPRHSVPVQGEDETIAAAIRYFDLGSTRKVKAMKKIILAVATAATLAVTALAAPAPAEARDGGAVAAGVIGGLAAGAIIGSAAANSGYGYGPGYGYYGGGPAYVAAPCYWQRQRFWDGYGWRIRRVQVCE